MRASSSHEDCLVRGLEIQDGERWLKVACKRGSLGCAELVDSLIPSTKIPSYTDIQVTTDNERWESCSTHSGRRPIIMYHFILVPLMVQFTNMISCCLIFWPMPKRTNKPTIDASLYHACSRLSSLRQCSQPT